MADITMCRNDLCPMQSCCYKQTAIRSEMQYMANFGYKTDGKTGAFSCDNFWRDESKPMPEGYLHGA